MSETSPMLRVGWRSVLGVGGRSSTARLVALSILAVGLLVFACGMLADLAFHLLPPGLGGGLLALLAAGGRNAHLVTLIGMVLVLASIALRGIAGRPASQ